jgi:NAD(P)-dependent dehydrogenase (short-subunit alcohol dehydrogenase family)
MMGNVVITGGKSGLGLELAQAYLAAGHQVVVGCRNAAAAPVGEAHELDMADDASIVAFAAAVGDRPVNVLINNAGIDARAVGAADGQREVMTISSEAFHAVLQVNTIAPMLLTRALAPNLRTSGDAKVVNISSQVGAMVIGQKMGRDISYAASKAALNMVSIKLGQALKADGVTVVAMHPGYLRTSMGGPGADLDPADAAAAIVATVAALTLDQTCSFIRWDGSEHPW